MKPFQKEREKGSTRQRHRQARILRLGACLQLPGLSGFHSRRGSTMVEATMVLPLLILSVLTCILVSMFFYETSMQQCRLHKALRCQAGICTGSTNTLTAPEYDGDDLSIARSGIFKTVSGSVHTTMLHRGLLRTAASSQMQSRWHAADGVSYVRYCRLVKGSGESMR